METKDFCYWLQGFFELDNSEVLTSKQIKTIKEKLNSCFAHEVVAPKKQNPVPIPRHPNYPDERVRC